VERSENGDSRSESVALLDHEYCAAVGFKFHCVFPNVSIVFLIGFICICLVMRLLTAMSPFRRVVYLRLRRFASDLQHLMLIICPYRLTKTLGFNNVITLLLAA
jgi:hypothetical protein